jgi:hypothetical protein
MGMLSKIFKAVAEPFMAVRRDKMRSYADYYAGLSKKVDDVNNAELLARIDEDAMVLIRDVDKALKSLSCRKIYGLSSYDMQTYIAPIFAELELKIKKGDIACKVRPQEKLMEGGAVQAGAILDILNTRYVPDFDHKTTVFGVIEEAVPIDPDFGDSKLGRLRQKWYEKFPLRTPSTPVRYEKRQTEDEVDIRRMVILALGYADKMDKYLHDTPFYSESVIEREIADQKRPKKRIYRGQEY